jgi:hypothetical protein
MDQQQQPSVTSNPLGSSVSGSSLSSTEDQSQVGDLGRPTGAPHRPSLFHSVVRMMALVEGGIIEHGDPEFGFAVNDALYGILLNKEYRIVYTQQYGLQVIDFI